MNKRKILKLLPGAGQATHSDVIVHGKAVKACDRDCKRSTPVVEQLNLDDSNVSYWSSCKVELAPQ